ARLPTKRLWERTRVGSSVSKPGRARMFRPMPPPWAAPPSPPTPPAPPCASLLRKVLCSTVRNAPARPTTAPPLLSPPPPPAAPPAPPTPRVPKEGLWAVCPPAGEPGARAPPPPPPPSPAGFPAPAALGRIAAERAVADVEGCRPAAEQGHVVTEDGPA